MTTERAKAINEWLSKHCRNCANNDDRGTEFVNCQAECEVQKDIGVACIHYEKYVEESGARMRGDILEDDYDLEVDEDDDYDIKEDE